MNTVARRVSIRVSMLLLAAGAVAGVAVPVGGADSPPGPQAGTSRPGPPPLETYVRSLGLTAAQQAKLKPVLETARESARSDIEQASAGGQKVSAEQMNATIKMREADLRESLAKILTPEQLAKYDQQMAPQPSTEREVRDPHGHHETMTPTTSK